MTWRRLGWPTASSCWSSASSAAASRRTVRKGPTTARPAPVLLAGRCVRPGLHGAYPSLTDLADGDLKMTVDFRRVYATVLEGWLGLRSKEALGGTFEPLPQLLS